MTRRMFELVVVTVVLVEVVRTGIGKVWAHKALITTRPGSASHSAAEVGVIIT
jgi:hypothetical protein